jgi:predicted MFS family arabinose efflux permease
MRAKSWLGGVIYITMFDRITKASGFPWAIRGMGFVALACALISFPALLSGSAVLARPRKARRLFDRTALHDRLFILFTISTFFNFLGYIVPYFYIPTYAREHLGSTDSMALYMLVMSLAGTFFGRLASGLVAHYLGSVVTWALCCLGSGILALCWISIETERAFIAFSIMWGECTDCRNLILDVWLTLYQAFCPPPSLRCRLPPSRAFVPICAFLVPELVCLGASRALRH